MANPSPHPGSAVRDLFIYLAVRGADKAIAFYTSVFRGEETMRLAEPDGRITHAELRLGPATLMLADEQPEAGFRSPLDFGGTGTTIHVHVDEVDAVLRRAVEGGAVVLREAADQAHGERQAKFRDPFGHEWLLGQELERLSDDEIRRRFEAG